MVEPFRGNFTQQEPIDEAAINAAVDVLRSGRLHRYNVVAGEEPAAAQLERAFADYQGSAFALSCASGGYAMQLALRAAGCGKGQKVLTNAFTLAPVPGAIAAVGAETVLVETTASLTIDLDDLDSKLAATNAKTLLLSHMRGHIVDMDALAAILARHEAQLIEDCAHTMGATWAGRKSGSFGLAGCFSTQTYKHLNSGEGGLLTSDDAAFMARCILLSGSYMLYERHGAAPAPHVFDALKLDVPNMSGRMDNLRAAVLVPQIAHLDSNIARWNERYLEVERGLRASSAIRVIERPQPEFFVGSSIQFLLPGVSPDAALEFVQANAKLGVELKWFGAEQPSAFTSSHRNWHYIPQQNLPQTDAVLAGLFDMRIPLTFDTQDCRQIGEIIAHCATSLDT